MRGSFDDNLFRFILTRRTWTLGRVFRVTGDHPTADADLVDALVAGTTGAEHSFGRVDIDRVPERQGFDTPFRHFLDT